MLGLVQSGRTHKARAAFTLIEMLVVIVIMAVFASVAVPQYSRMLARADFDAALQTVVEALDTAKDMAIRYGADSTVTFDAQTQGLTVSIPAPAPATDAPIVMQDQLSAQPLPEPRVLNLGEKVMITNFQSFSDTGSVPGSASGAAIRFRDDGSSSGGRLTIVSAEGYSAVVEVAPATGNPRITDQQ
ncbi:MAG: pilus assembly FimT family protein [Chthonomonadales bacterium]